MPDHGEANESSNSSGVALEISHQAAKTANHAIVRLTIYRFGRTSNRA
jgi:hypothetical protein